MAETLRPIGPKLVLATHNAGKLREFRGLVAPFDLTITSAGELGLAEPEETGTTFEENAATKALFAARESGLPALSDDSGLCVDALDGAPGVYTADWATLADGSRDFGVAMKAVEDKLATRGARAPEERRGKFVAVLCLAFPDGETDYYRGEAPGHLVWPPRGDLGFGYDPVFVPDGFDITFGQMSADEKHGWVPGQAKALSHRARAFQRFAEARLIG